MWREASAALAELAWCALCLVNDQEQSVERQSGPQVPHTAQHATRPHQQRRTARRPAPAPGQAEEDEEEDEEEAEATGLRVGMACLSCGPAWVDADVAVTDWLTGRARWRGSSPSAAAVAAG